MLTLTVAPCTSAAEVLAQQELRRGEEALHAVQWHSAAQHSEKVEGGSAACDSAAQRSEKVEGGVRHATAQRSAAQ